MYFEGEEIGIQDKNGVMIREGDRVRIVGVDRLLWEGTVRYKPDYGCFAIVADDGFALLWFFDYYIQTKSFGHKITLEVLHE